MQKKAFSSSSIIEKATTAFHGALNYQELESLNIEPDQVIDFSSNINPYGPPQGVPDGLSNIDSTKYPDRDSIALRTVLAEQLNITIDQIMVGNGTAELIWLIAFAFVQPGDDVAILGPTFGEYERCVRLMGGQVKWIKALPENEFAFGIQELHQALEDIQPKFCIICNPNNPTGTILKKEDIFTLAQAHQNTGVILDEAYLSFVPELTSSISLNLPNLLVMRSMTKDFSLAGLRLGYAIGLAEIIGKISQVAPAWNVNSYAQAAGLAALAQKDFMARSNDRLKVEKKHLVSALGKQGYSIFPSKTHYFLMDVGDAAAFRLRLLQEHFIQVRDCTSFGLPAMVRVSTRQREENQQLLDALWKINT